MGEIPLLAHGKVTQLTPMLRRGIVSGLYPFPCNSPHGFSIDVMIQGGESGSPIFLEDSPTVVGMVAARYPQTNITIALPSHLLAKALEVFTQANPIDLDELPPLRSFLSGQIEQQPNLSWETFRGVDPAG